MRIKNKSEFGDLSTAVFYKFNKFLPDGNSSEIDSDFKTVIESDLDNYRATKISYHGGTKRFDGIDFAEYDFSYVLENQKFNNKDLISYLVDEDRNEIGFNLGSLEKVNATLFPTIEENGTESAYDYFGSLVLSTATIYLFNLDPGYYKIELYEDYINTNNTLGGFIDSDYLKLLKLLEPDDPDKLLVEPVVTIYLGPESKYKDNPSFMYYPSLPYSYNRTEVFDETGVKYSKLYDEIYSGKAVWLALAPDNSIKQLNLSYNAWLNSEDANRNKHRHNLRNDRYYGSEKFDIIKREEYTDFLNDVRSGKLLGTQILAPSKEILPILQKKTNFVNESAHYYYIETSTSPSDPERQWDEFRIYNRGDIVWSPVSTKYYISITDGNSGFDPADTEGEWMETTVTLKTSIVADWDSSILFKRGEYTRRNGKYYVALESNIGHDPETDTEYWNETENEPVNYNPEVEYEKGRVVKYDNEFYTAIKKGNRGRRPSLSSYWILRDKLIDFYTTRITLISYPATCGYSIPSRQITLDSDSSGSSMIFKIIPHPGFGLTSVQYQNHDNQKVNLVKGQDYTETDYISGTESYKEVVILQPGWDKILGSDSRERILFEFTSAKIKGTLRYVNVGNTSNVEIYGFSEDNAPSTSNKVYLGSLSKDGVDYTTTTDIQNALLDITKDSELEFTFYTLHDGLDFYRFSDINVKKSKDGVLGELDITPETSIQRREWGSQEIEIMTAKFSLVADCTDFYVDLEISNTRVVTFDYFEDFEVRDIVSEVAYGGTFVTQFYGTYGDDFAYVKIGDIELSKDHTEEGDCRLEVNNGMYTLTISNITENTMIEIYNSNTI